MGRYGTKQNSISCGLIKLLQCVYSSNISVSKNVFILPDFPSNNYSCLTYHLGWRSVAVCCGWSSRP